MLSNSFPVLLVGGPTASGKTALALKLAADLGAEIINADSVQVYRGCDVGSAKPSAEERAAVPHHLLDVCEPAVQYHAGKFVEDAARAISEVTARGKRPLFVGGTNLYLTALFHGLAKLPKANAAFRKELESCTDEELHSRLEQADPESAKRIHRHDRIRAVRALEAFHETGISQHDLHREHEFREEVRKGLLLVVVRDRAELYDRIARRTGVMMENGLVGETRAIAKRAGKDAPPLKTLGYAQALAFIEGHLSEVEMRDAIVRETRRFAKRQLTYWRNEPGKRGWNIRPGEGEGIELDEEQPKRMSGRLKPFRVLSLSYAELLRNVETRLAKPFERTEVWYLDGKRI